MSVLEFIAAVVGSLAWPVVVVVAVVVLRKQLRDLVARLIARLVDLTEVSGWGLSMKFKEKLDELEREVEEINAKAAPGTKKESKPEDSGAPGEPQESAQTAASATESAQRESVATESAEKAASEEDPLVSLLRANRVVGRAIKNAAIRNGIDPRRAASPTMALKLLSTKVKIDSGVRDIVADLVRLRNQAVHEELQVSPEDAARYTWIADDIAEYLDRL